MKSVKILGSGCKKCEQTADMVKDVAAAAGVDISLEKVQDMAKIMEFGVMSTPGVVVDGVVVHAGGLPDPEKIRKALA